MNRVLAGAIAVLVLAQAAPLAGCGENRRAATPGYRLYVSNEATGDVSVIDEPAHAVVARIALGKRPRGLRVSADGRRLFVALSGSPVAPPGVDESALPPADKAADGIGVVDTVSLKTMRVIRGVANPEQLALASNARLYAADEDSRSLATIDAGTGAILARLAIGQEPEGLATSPGGRYVYVTAEGDDTLVVVDAGAGKIARRIAVGKRPRGIAVSPDGARVYVTNENGASLTTVDAASGAVIHTTAIPGAGAKPMGVATSPDGKRIYVTTGRGGALVAIDAVSVAVVKSAVVGKRPWGVAVSPDGRFVYTANGPSDDVSVVDAASLAVVARIKVGQHPWGVVAAPPRPRSGAG